MMMRALLGFLLIATGCVSARVAAGSVVSPGGRAGWEVQLTLGLNRAVGKNAVTLSTTGATGAHKLANGLSERYVQHQFGIDYVSVAKRTGEAGSRIGLRVGSLVFQRDKAAPAGSGPPSRLFSTAGVSAAVFPVVVSYGAAADRQRIATGLEVNGAILRSSTGAVDARLFIGLVFDAFQMNK